MARWLAFRGAAVVGRLDAPDQVTALARARQVYGASRVQSVASYEVSVLERQPKGPVDPDDFDGPEAA